MLQLTFVSLVMMFSRAFAEICYFHYDVNYGCDMTYGDVIQTLNAIVSIMVCLWKCGENDKCLTVKYDPFNKVCLLNSVRYTSMSTDCSQLVEYASLNKDSCRPQINKACTKDSECPVSHSQCLNKICQCDPGYIYKRSNDSCLTGCDVYGSTFTQYVTSHMNVVNKWRVKRLPSLEKCEQACVEERRFVCCSVSYHTDDEQCAMHELVNSKYSSKKLSLLFYKRDCQ